MLFRSGSSDGSAMQGVVGMDGAAPIVRDALLAIARHVRLTLPARPDDVVDVEVCATSGQRPGPHCPRIHDVAAHPISGGPCDWHRDDGHGHATVVYPPRARGWLDRMRQLATVR